MRKGSNRDLMFGAPAGLPTMARAVPVRTAFSSKPVTSGFATSFFGPSWSWRLRGDEWGIVG